MNRQDPKSDDALQSALDALEDEAARLAAISDPQADTVMAFAMSAKSLYEAIWRLEQTASKPVIDDEDIRRLSDAAARGADRRAVELARTHQWRLLLAVAAFVTVLAGAAASAGYWAGGGFNTTCWPQKGGLACGYWLVDPAR